MPASRVFDFPISALIRDARRLLGAVLDPTVGSAVARRLAKKAADPTQPATQFAPGFEAQINLVGKGGTNQSTAIGTIGELTQEQAEAFSELERLMAGARRSATLAFPKNDARLHSEFQVGNRDPQDLASELERAEKIVAACRTHAAVLDDHGWLEEDTATLAAAVSAFGTGDEDQEAAKDKKKGLTAARNLAANALYKQCLTVQNAARLAYPSTRIDKDSAVTEARARFLLDEFPPRGGASAGDKPAEPAAPPQPAAPK